MSNAEPARPFSYARLLVVGFGFFGVQILWSVYNAYVPIFLQAGRADYSATAGVEGFGLGARMTGVVMTLDNLAALAILPYVGALSDRLRTRWGRRKPFLAVGAPVAAIGVVAVPLALGGSLAWFMAAIAVTLLAMDFFRTPVVSLMPDITPSEKRSVGNGVINLMGGLGAFAALMVGGLLFKVSPRAPFFFAAAAMLVGVGLVLLFVKEPPPERAGPAEDEPSLLASFGQVLRDGDRSALRILGSIFFWFLGYTAVEVFFTSYAVNALGADSGEATVTLSYFSFSILAFSIPAGFVGMRFGRRKTILASIVAFSTLLGLAFGLQSVAQAKMLLVPMGLFWTTIVVNSLPMVVDCAPPNRVGTYTGLYYLASQSSSVLGPILGGQIVALFGNDYRIIFPYAAVCLLVAGVSMFGVRRGEAKVPVPAETPEPAAPAAAA